MRVSLRQVRRALAVCFGLARKGSLFDCVVATPDALPPRLRVLSSSSVPKQLSLLVLQSPPLPSPLPS